MNLDTLMPVLQLFLTTGNVCVMIYALSKFLQKPHDTLEQRVTTLEVKQQEIERSLRMGNDEFREMRETTKMMTGCLLSLIDFEIQYCLNTHYEVTEDLMHAKKVLHEYLSEK